MENEEITTDVTIKSEIDIDIEEEKLIRVNTDNAQIPLNMAISPLEKNPNAQTDPVNVNLYKNIQIQIKQEADDKNIDKTDKPTVIREAESFITQAHTAQVLHNTEETSSLPESSSVAIKIYKTRHIFNVQPKEWTSTKEKCFFEARERKRKLKAAQRASETPIQREKRLAALRKSAAIRRANQRIEKERVHHQALEGSGTQDQAVATVVPGTMETEEPGVTIKNEIDIEEEKLIRVNTDNAHIPVKMEITLLDDPSAQADPVNENLYENIQIEIKQEADDKENDFWVERNDKTDKPTVIREPDVFNTQAHIDARVKEEQSIVEYDFPNFDDAGSMDSNDAEALGNVETSLQDEVEIKTESGGHQNLHHVYHNNEVKMESEIIPDKNPSNQITPDGPETGPKYSFVMKIPGEVLNNFDQIVSSDLVNGNDNESEPTDTICPDGETKNNDTVDMNMDIATSDCATEHTSLLEATDQSETYDLNPFQLNSITGNVLSLEQEAYIMLQPKKTIFCPKCPKRYHRKYALKPHLKVHQTIENYANGRKRGVETARKNRMKRLQQLLKQEIYEQDSQDSCSNHQEDKQENKEGYKCTCGKTFQRRTRMETCLKSHDYSQSEKYYCMTCLKDFKSKDELALHRKRLHRKKFPCKFCPTDYATRKKLFRHLQIHQKVHQMEFKVIEEVVKTKKKLRCFFCSKSCEDISELQIHVMSEHKGPYSCPHCKNTFPKIIDFGNHTKTYHPEVGEQPVMDVLEAFSRLTQEWKCEECDMQFLEADKLALHQVEQHNPEVKSDLQFQCPDCRRVFISQKGLTSHRRIHHSVETTEQAKVEDPGIMCLECRKMCKDMSALTSHMRFHSPDRKYPCKFCDFRFATPEKRKTHADIHTGDMKYVCFICEYQCSSENRLKKHKQSLKHANMREYLLTGKPLIEEPPKVKKEGSTKKRKKSKDDSKSDKKTASNDEVTCDVCGEKFPSESQMLEHKETHPFIEIPSGDKTTRIFFK